MTAPKQFTYRQDGLQQFVELDGEDISRLVRSVSFDVGVHEIPAVRLELAVFEFESVSGQTEIHIADGTADLLKKLGWTPPEES